MKIIIEHTGDELLEAHNVREVLMYDVEWEINAELELRMVD